MQPYMTWTVDRLVLLAKKMCDLYFKQIFFKAFILYCIILPLLADTDEEGAAQVPMNQSKKGYGSCPFF